MTLLPSLGPVLSSPTFILLEVLRACTSSLLYHFSMGPVHSNLNRLQQILISRFILNLRRCADDTSGMISTVEHDSTNLLGFSFHRSGNATTGLLGSMEGDLTHGVRGEEDDDESFDIRPID